MRHAEVTTAPAQGAASGRQGGNQAEIRQAIEEAQTAAREAAQAAAEAAREAGRTAAEAARTADEISAQDRADRPSGRDGVIVIPGEGGNDVAIRVDGQGIHVEQGGRPEVVIPIHDVVPRGAVQITYAISAALVAVAIVGPLLRFFLRRHERRAVTTQLSAEVQARLDAMDRNIDTVAVELERVSEGQRFMNKLLEQRPLEHAQRSDR